MTRITLALLIRPGHRPGIRAVHELIFHAGFRRFSGEGEGGFGQVYLAHEAGRSPVILVGSAWVCPLTRANHSSGAVGIEAS
jgi:hypothetical protein